MSRWSKLVDQARNTPKSIRFAELCALVHRMGYELARQRGSHLHFRRPGCPAINLQDDGSGMAKPYQVKQVLEILDSCGMEP